MVQKETKTGANRSGVREPYCLNVDGVVCACMTVSGSAVARESRLWAHGRACSRARGRPCIPERRLEGRYERQWACRRVRGLASMTGYVEVCINDGTDDAVEGEVFAHIGNRVGINLV